MLDWWYAILLPVVRVTTPCPYRDIDTMRTPGPLYGLAARCFPRLAS